MTRRAISLNAASVAVATTPGTASVATSPLNPPPTTPPKPPEEHRHVQVLSPPQVLQVHRRGRHGDRLQGSQHPAPEPDRERQDRPEPHHRHPVALPAPPRHSSQPPPLPSPASLSQHTQPPNKHPPP